MTKSVYKIFYTALIMLLLYLGYGAYLGMGQPETWGIIIIFGVSFVLSSLELAPRNIRHIAPIAIILGTGIYSITINRDENLEIIREYWEYIIRGMAVCEEHLKDVQSIQVLMVTILIYLLVTVMVRIQWIKYITGATAVVVPVYMVLIGRTVEHICVVLTMVFFISIFTEWIQAHWKKRSSGDMESYMTWLIPFMMAFAILLNITPYSEEPYDWKYVKAAYNAVKERVDTIASRFGAGEREDFDTTMTGFSDSSTFFGNINDSNRDIMTIEGNKALVTNVYLTGKCYDSFYGRGWEQLVSERLEDRLMDGAETVYSTQCYDARHQKAYMSPAKITVKFEDYTSQYTFVPLKMSKYEEIGAIRQGVENEDILSGSRKSLGYEYTIDFYQLNIDHSVFYQMLEEEYKNDESRWNYLRRSFGVESEKLEELQAYDEQILLDYSQEIELSEAMRDWVEQNTQGATTPVARLKMLEYALSQMEYSKEPGKIPDEVDSAAKFLDYFILENPRGYCTYYATAFALLARAEGFPTRYAEGFCVPMKKGKTVVTSNMAHAWPEVYFKGRGWIPFEPTPGYDVLRYTPWEVDEATGDEMGAGAGSYWEYRTNAGEVSQQEVEDVTLIEVTKEKEYWRLTVLIIIVLVMITIVEQLIVRYRYSKMPIQKKYSIGFQRNMRILVFLKLGLGQGETIAELDGRLKEQSDRWGEEEYLFLKRYEEYRYGGCVITQQMVDELETERRRLLKHIRFRIGSLYIAA